MSARVPRHIAKELIQFVKRVEVRANFWDPSGGAKAAFEFGRQMSSPKLLKLNASYSCDVLPHSTEAAPVVEAEFLDGSKVVLEVQGKTCADLRSALFDKASEAEEVLESKGAGGAGGGAGGAAAASKGGAKGGAAAAGGKKK